MITIVGGKQKKIKASQTRTTKNTRDRFISSLEQVLTFEHFFIDLNQILATKHVYLCVLISINMDTICNILNNDHSPHSLGLFV